jgi:tRNA(Ile)-lysidine synthase
MANLKSQPLSNQTLLLKVRQSLLKAFEAINKPSPHVLLAYSGGLDSTVLLHLLTQLNSQISFQLKAMHVHHGLSPNADFWTQHCKETCAKYAVPLLLSQVKVDAKSGLGIEASARSARYQALYQAQADMICLAHHQDDQAETFLLQLARGSGVKGLAGMAAIDLQRKLLRPLLEVDRATLESYAHQHQLQWVEDESNEDTAFDRNFIRHEILPMFKTQYPAINKTLSRTARHLAEASQLLEELAKIDAESAIIKTSDSLFAKLDLKRLVLLSEVRAKNLIRWWLVMHQSCLPNLLLPSADVLDQIVNQLLHTQSDTKVKIKVGQHLFVRKYLENAYLVVEHPSVPSFNILWQGEAEIKISEGVHLTFNKQQGEGLSLQKLAHVKLRVKNREGGERFKPDIGRPKRTIKRMLQEYNIPPWQRECLPLVFMDEILVAIPNLAVDADLKASPSELGLVIQCVMA